MTFDQPGGQSIVRQIDYSGVVRRIHFRGKSHLLNAVALNQNDPSVMQLLPVENCVRP